MFCDKISEWFHAGNKKGYGSMTHGAYGTSRTSEAPVTLGTN